MKKVLFSILALSLLCVPAVMAQGRGGPPHQAGHMIERIVDRLDLSEADAELFVQEMESHRESMAPLTDELGELRQALNDQISADVFDEAAIRDRASEVARLEADVAVARAQHWQEIRSILTEEQWAQFKEMRQRRERGAMGMGRGHRPAGRPGGPPRGR